VVGRLPGVGVELEPGGAGVAVAGLADAAGVEEPAALGDVELVPLGGLAAGGIGLVAVREVQGDVGVPDQAHPLSLLVHAFERLVEREHVLPDRVAGGGVVEADLAVGHLGLEALQELDRRLVAVLARPLDSRRRGARENLGVDLSGHREVVVADEGEIAALGCELRAVVGLGPVADDVSQAPALVQTGLVDRPEDGLERRQVRVDVGQDRDAHGCRRRVDGCRRRSIVGGCARPG
jgi:hypothetical protein